MSLSKEEKLEIIKKFGVSELNTGSPEVQVALLTADINKLTGHFKTHAKDAHSRRGLIRKVNLRRNILSYLRRKDIARYRKIIKELKIRAKK
jgi:small subunit ribosomal protein S15